MIISENNSVKTYNLSSDKTINDIKQKKDKKKNKEFEKNLEILHEFKFPCYSNQIEITNDKNYIICSGMYGPQIKIFDLNNASLKCMRGLDSEIVKFCMLSDDYKKIAMASFDRNIEIHAQYGKHFKFRVPKTPRDIIFNKYTADLIVASCTNEIYRINLEDGKFLKNFETNNKTIGNNTIKFIDKLNLLAVGGDEGILNLFDYRERKLVGNVKVNNGQNINKIAFNNEFEMLIGSSEGLIRLYDLRYNNHIKEYKHPYMLPINSINTHNRNLIISSDSKSIRIYNKNNGKLFTTYEPSFSINETINFDKESGLILATTDMEKMGVFFMPRLGSAPKFCQHIENITEELEEKNNNIVYDDKKFLNYSDLEKLKATNLIGTKSIQSHLNGFIMDYKLYEKLKNKNEVFDYEKYKREQIELQIKKKMDESIYIKEKGIKINKKIIAKIDKNKKVTQIYEDNRFKKNLFHNKNFKINENSDEYKLHNSSNKKIIKEKEVSSSNEEDSEQSEDYDLNDNDIENISSEDIKLDKRNLS